MLPGVVANGSASVCGVGSSFGHGEQGTRGVRGLREVRGAWMWVTDRNRVFQAAIRAVGLSPTDLENPQPESR